MSSLGQVPWLRRFLAPRAEATERALAWQGPASTLLESTGAVIRWANGRPAAVDALMAQVAESSSQAALDSVDPSTVAGMPLSDLALCVLSWVEFAQRARSDEPIDALWHRHPWLDEEVCERLLLEALRPMSPPVWTALARAMLVEALGPLDLAAPARTALETVDGEDGLARTFLRFLRAPDCEWRKDTAEPTLGELLDRFGRNTAQRNFQFVGRVCVAAALAALMGDDLTLALPEALASAKVVQNYLGELPARRAPASSPGELYVRYVEDMAQLYGRAKDGRAFAGAGGHGCPATSLTQLMFGAYARHLGELGSASFEEYLRSGRKAPSSFDAAP